MADTVLTLSQIENLFQTWTTQMIGLDPAITANQDKVRISYPADGQPGWKITDDIIFLKVNNEPDPIDKQRDVVYSEKDDDTAIRQVSYTRVHSIKWTLYGPNSFNNADKIKNALYLPTYKELFSKNNLFLVLKVENPVRFPELYNGQWWERTDFEASFNEKVVRTTEVPYIETSAIQIVKG